MYLFFQILLFELYEHIFAFEICQSIPSLLTNNNTYFDDLITGNGFQKKPEKTNNARLVTNVA